MHHLLVCCGLPPVLDAIELDQPVVRLAQDAQGSSDFEDVLVHFQTTPQPDTSEVKPACFELYNVQGGDGRAELSDPAAGVRHTVEALHLKLPFISTRPSQSAGKVLAQLSMRLNGGDIATQAAARPFVMGHSAQATLRLQQVDLAPHTAYVPARVPVRWAGALLADSQGVIDLNLPLNGSLNDA